MAQSQTEECSVQNLRAPQLGARITISNLVGSNMSLDKSYTWSGPTNPNFPNPIRKDETESFNHQASANSGSKGAAVYRAPNANGTPSAWVLAWDAPNDTDTSANKVCVLTGTLARITSLGETGILAALDNSFANPSEIVDPVSKTKAFASIDYSAGTRMAIVSADFSLSP